MKYRFWAIQPVFHFYDFSYWIYNKGIIRCELPEKNRYTNFINIKTISFEKIVLTSREFKQFVKLIQNHYLKQEDNQFCPSISHIVPYFTGHSMESYFSFYYQPILLEDIKNQTTIKDSELIGVITTRPLHVSILKKDKIVSFPVYYVDYLCVHKRHRKKNIAPSLIQTHEYNQSHSNKKISVSLFKREGELTGIIPICVYKTYCFYMKYWLIPDPLPLGSVLLQGDSQNLYYLYSFIKENTKKWDLLILPEISNLIELVRSKNVFITMLKDKQTIYAAYFFRKVCTSISQGKEVVSCFASIQCSEFCSDSLFIHGFKSALSQLIQQYNEFYYLCIEHMNDNGLIIQNLLLKSFPESISPTAYFFYNFAYQPFVANKILIVN